MAETQSFNLLDSQIQRWIWKKGWKSLLEIQENTIPLVLKGDSDIIVSAPTGGGKTEAVFLPIISKMLHESDGFGYYALYISPLKALINDQTRRLTDICDDLGIDVTAWHGDITGSKKSRSFKYPSGILIITPESLESVLMHKREDTANAFSQLRYIIIDEIHSFVGKERGKQIQSLMSRIDHIVGRCITRIGMSATLSDYGDIKTFIRPDKSVNCEVPKAGNQLHEIKVLIKEYIGNDEDECFCQIATDLFARLRGANNLVFTQSRRDAEKFSILLSDLSHREGVPNEFYIHHSSIDKEDRHFLEQTLQKGLRPTTAICTSTLELGIDVGSVKSIAQIATCPSVSSLRQRLGRSGRRDAPSILRVYNIDLDSPKNIRTQLSLSLIKSIATIELIRDNKFEPYNLERYHFSTLIQQILSVLTQYGSFYAKEGWMLLCQNGAFNNVTPELFLSLLSSLGEQGIISQTHTGQIVVGEVGEKIIRNLDFYAAFKAEKEVLVIEKKTGKYIGSVNLNLPVGEILILSGRYWIVLDNDERGARLIVEQTSPGGWTYFKSTTFDIDRIIVEKAREVFLSEEVYPYLDAAARNRLDLARKTFIQIGLSKTNYVSFNNNYENDFFNQHNICFTWAGSRINRTLSLTAYRYLDAICSDTPFYIMGFTEEMADRLQAIKHIDALELASLIPRIEKEKEKYDKMLPDDLLDLEYAKSYLDVDGMMEYLKTI